MHSVYRIKNHLNRIVYIGQTKNIHVRAHRHEHKQVNGTIEFCEVECAEHGKRIELVLLSLFKPILNIRIPKSNPLMPEGVSFNSLTWQLLK